MKVALISMSGTVGKTTLASYLILPRMPEDTRFFALESVNESADQLGVENVEKMRGREFIRFYEELLDADDAVIDIGVSNVEAFLSNAKRQRNLASEVDYFVIPVKTGGARFLREATATVEELLGMNVNPDQIRIVFNMIEDFDIPQLKDIFSPLFELAKVCKCPVMVSDKYVLRDDPMYNDLNGLGWSLEKLMADKTDYKALQKDEKDRERRKAYTRMRRLQGEAAPVHEELDALFSALFPNEEIVRRNPAAPVPVAKKIVEGKPEK
ncbi:StbB family protein [Acetobacter persici]|uniref:StbB family protein n=1 Tax=Acetobacter persici TaxID=1076596 RepID=UPI001BA755A3|nr:StbB family protein [Acetobacter persici]MBS1017025.1 hypothetical protein [Acetobacter persici]